MANEYRYNGTDPLDLTLQISMVDADGVAIDLTAAVSVQMLYRLADGTTGSWTAAITLPATDGIITYKLIAGDFPLGEGLHQVTGQATWAAGFVSLGVTPLEFIIKDTWDQ